MITDRTRKSKLKTAFDHAMVSLYSYESIGLNQNFIGLLIGYKPRVQGLPAGSHDACPQGSDKGHVEQVRCEARNSRFAK